MTTTMMTQPNTAQSVYDKLREYNGNNTFILSLKLSLSKYGKLTERQLPHAIKFFEQSNNSVQLVGAKVYPVYVLKTPTLIRLDGKFFVKDLCENKLLLGDVISYAWVVSEVTGITNKAIKVKAKIADSKYSLNFCRACCRSLTDEFSIATGMGKICSQKYGVTYITDLSQVDKFKLSLDEKINQIGEKEFWLPKSKVNYQDLQSLLSQIDNGTSPSVQETAPNVNDLSKNDLFNSVCDSLMSQAISLSVLADNWSVKINEQILITANFNDCSKIFIDEYNKGKDVILYLLSNENVMFNNKNLD